MVVPSGMMVRIAADQLADQEYRKAHAWVWPDQKKEVEGEIPSASDDFKAGYELALQVARVYLSLDPAAAQAKVDF